MDSLLLCTATDIIEPMLSWRIFHRHSLSFLGTSYPQFPSSMIISTCATVSHHAFWTIDTLLFASSPTLSGSVSYGECFCWLTWEYFVVPLEPHYSCCFPLIGIKKWHPATFLFYLACSMSRQFTRKGHPHLDLSAICVKCASVKCVRVATLSSHWCSWWKINRNWGLIHPLSANPSATLYRETF